MDYKKLDREKLDRFESLELMEFLPSLDSELLELAYLSKKLTKKFQSVGYFDERTLIEIRSATHELEKIFKTLRKKTLEYKQKKNGSLN